MDDKEFRKRLSEVADWRIPETITGTKDGDAKKPRKRGRPSAEEEYQNAREEMFLTEFGGVNQTFPPQIIKLKKQGCECSDCGQWCEEGRHTERKCYETSGIRNWRERCLTCEKTKNPFTEKFDLTISEAPHVWTEFLRVRKGAYKTKKNLAREEAGVIRNSQEIYGEDK